MGTEAASGPQHASPLTLQQWARLPEDEGGELVDGVLQEDEMTDFAHEVVVAFLVEVFRRWVRPRGGIVGGSEAKFAVSDARGRKADVAVYLPGDPKPPARGIIGIPPGIVVEVVSPRPRDARRDRIEKSDDYARFGVRWYWIVDPQLRTLEIHERSDDGRYIRALGRSDGVVDPVPGCPDLVVDLDALWAELDELEPSIDAE